MPERRENTMTQVGKYLSLVLIVPSGALAGYWLGEFASRWARASWPVGVGVAVGILAGAYKVFEQLWREAKRDDRERRERGA
jgi:hypothetical protein